MRVGLIDVDDAGWRNLHLMRRAAFHKAQGDEVIFPYDGATKVDKVVMSTVFTRNRPLVAKWARLLTGLEFNIRTPWEDQVLCNHPATRDMRSSVKCPKDDEDKDRPDWVAWEIWAFLYDTLMGLWSIEVGGTGWNIHAKAPDEIEVMEPDYRLYDALMGPADYGQGFTTRGCPRDCHFCVVPIMSGRVPKPQHTLAELRNGDSKRIKLMDDNFWAPASAEEERGGNPWWRQRMIEAIDAKYQISFTQGLDIRFVNEERAELLARLAPNPRAKRDRARFWTEGFTSNMVTFAFDSPKIEGQYRRGFETLIKAGLKAQYVASFVLMGFESTPEEDDHRLAVLRELGAYPYAMVYEPIHGEAIPEFYLKEKNAHILARYGEHLSVEEQYHRHWQRCKHIQRWCNKRQLWGSIPDFERYESWKKQQASWREQDQRLLFRDQQKRLFAEGEAFQEQRQRRTHDHAKKQEATTEQPTFAFEQGEQR